MAYSNESVTNRLARYNYMLGRFGFVLKEEEAFGFRFTTRTQREGVFILEVFGKRIVRRLLKMLRCTDIKMFKIMKRYGKMLFYFEINALYLPVMPFVLEQKGKRTYTYVERTETQARFNDQVLNAFRGDKFSFMREGQTQVIYESPYDMPLKNLNAGESPLRLAKPPFTYESLKQRRKEIKEKHLPYSLEEVLEGYDLSNMQQQIMSFETALKHGS